MPTFRLLTPAGSVPLAGRELLVGSSPDCQVRAEGPDVASHHARIVIRENSPPLVEPVSPECRVLVDGKPVAGSTELRPGSTLRVGTTDIYVELGTMGKAAPVKKKKKPLWRRLLRLALYGVGALVLLLILAAVLTPVILNEARVKQTIKEELEKQLHRDVTIGGVELKLLRGLKITDLAVANKEGFTADRNFLTVKEADIRVDVLELLKSRLSHLDCSVTLEEPAVFLEREEKHGATNVDDLLAPEEPKDKKSRKKKGSKEGGEDSDSGPLGPVERLDVTLRVKGGSLGYDDRRARTLTRVENLGLKARVNDFDLPGLKGKLQYELSLAARSGGEPGKVTASGKADVSLDPRAEENALGLGVRVSGELLTLSVENLDASALARHLALPEPAKSVSLDLTIAATSADKLTVSGTLDVPQLDAVALRLHQKPVPDLGAKLTLSGSVDLASGNAALKLDGLSPLWEKLSAHLSVTELAALALASGELAEAATAGKITAGLELRADVETLTGGKVARLLEADAPVKGKALLSVQAKGTAGELPVKITAGLSKLLVPAKYTDGVQLPEEDITLTADCSLSLDTHTLALSESKLEAKITSAAIRGKVTDAVFRPAAGGKPAEAGGKLELAANFKQLADRYGKVLVGLPTRNEVLIVSAQASSAEGRPIQLSARIESRRGSGSADPLVLDLAAEAVQGSDSARPGHVRPVWNLEKLKITAQSPETWRLDAALSGSVRDFTAEVPSAELTVDLHADLERLWGRLAPFVRDRKALEGLAAMKFAGKLSVKGGRFTSSPEGVSSALNLDVTGLRVSGPDIAEEISDARLGLVVNADLKLDESRLIARALKLESSFCSLSLSGEVTDWGRLLGTYKLDLNVPDARKTTSLLAGMGFFPKDLKPRGSVVIAASADTAKGTVKIERCMLDTDLAQAKIRGDLQGMVARLEEFPGPDGNARLLVFSLKDASGSLAVEECSADVAVIGKLRKMVSAIPEDLKGAGPVKLSARLEGTPEKEFSVDLAFDATDARVAFGDLVNKPARTPAKLSLTGSWDPNTREKSLKMSTLSAQLGPLGLKGSGTADLVLTEKTAAPPAGGAPTAGSSIKVGRVAVKISIPEFEPEKVRALVPALGEFRFGGKLEIGELAASGDLEEFLGSGKDLFGGRLAGVTLAGRADLRDLTLEYSGLPKMSARCAGAVKLDTGAVTLENLALTLADKVSRHETRLVVTSGKITSAAKGAPLLSDLRRLSGELAVVSPEVKVEEVLAAIETPPAPAAPGGKPGPGKPPDAGKPKPSKPEEPTKPGAYDFLKGHRFTGSVRIDRVSYDRYTLTELAGDMALKENVFRLTRFAAKAYGGAAEGTAAVDLNPAKIAHSGKLTVRDVQANDVAAQVLEYRDVFHGKVGGELAWSGSGFEPGKAEDWKGSGQLTVAEGRAKNVERLPLYENGLRKLAEGLIRLGLRDAGELIKSVEGKDYTIDPAAIKVELVSENGQPFLRFTNVRTSLISKDPLAVGFTGGFALLAGEGGDRALSAQTRFQVLRIPNLWLDKLHVDSIVKLVPDQLRRYLPEADVIRITRDAIHGTTEKRDFYVTFGGSLAKPRPSALHGVGDLSKQIIKDLVALGTKNLLSGRKNEPRPEPPDQPKPEPGEEPGPVVATGKIQITKWDVGGNFLKPDLKVKAKVTGAGAAKLKLYGVMADGSVRELKSRDCADGDEVKLESSFTRVLTKQFELRLYDAGGKVMARERRKP